MENNNIKYEENDEEKVTDNILNILGILSFVVAAILYAFNNENYFAFILYGISYVLIGYELLWNAIKKLFKKDMFDENFLMSIATIGAFLIGEYNEALIVLILYKIGEYLQDLAVENSKKKIEKTLDLKPDYANLLKDNNITRVEPFSVNVGDVIVVKNGEKIPLDGKVIKGDTTLDTSAITGESKPISVGVNKDVLSGFLNLGETIYIEVAKKIEDSTISKIVKLIDEANEKKSNTEKFITKFAKIYTPIVTFLAVLITILLIVLFDVSILNSVKRALNFLVISCPCALVISVPLSYFIAIGECSKKGILVKGGNYLDILPKINVAIFDKTGTITKGNFSITSVVVKNKKYTQKNLIEKLKLVESLSNHYIAKSILQSKNEILPQSSKVKKYEEIPGHGVLCVLEDEEIIVGNEKILNKYNIKYDINEKFNVSSTVVHVARNKEYIGYVLLEDSIKDDATSTIARLKNKGIETILLTGDKKDIANSVGKRAGVDKIYYELLPNDKAKIVENIKDKKRKTIFVGDGINDAPVIAIADVGISMGKGSDIAVENSDIVLVTDEPSRLIDAINISKKTRNIVLQNIIVVFIVKFIFLALSAIGISSMWQAIFADVGISLLAILNCFRIRLK